MKSLSHICILWTAKSNVFLACTTVFFLSYFCVTVVYKAVMLEVKIVCMYALHKIRNVRWAHFTLLKNSSNYSALEASLAWSEYKPSTCSEVTRAGSRVRTQLCRTQD